MKRYLMALLGLAAGSVWVYARYIEPRWLSVESIPLTLPRLPQAFNRYRIVHISDLHLGGWMNPARLRRVIEAVNAERPDLVVITGDFVERFSNLLAEDLSIALQQIKAADGVIAVLGNHDYYNGAPGVCRALQIAGVRVLSNGVHTLHRADAQLHIAGLDAQTMQTDCLDCVLDKLPATGAAILLAHEPDFGPIAAATGRFDLQLSGHSHGGQVCLPFIGRPILPSYGIRYPAGLYTFDQMKLYTTRGVGMIRPYVRFNARPEITVFTLMADE